MLAIGAMIRAGLVAIVIAAASSTASAGGYIGLGIGTSPSGQIGNNASSMTTDGSRSWLGELGYRFGHLSVEGTGTEYTQIFNQKVNDATQLGLALKYSLPLSQGFEVFGRGGLQRTDVTDQINGNGWMLGAGFEFRFRVAMTGASAFVMYNHADTNMSTPSYPKGVDGTASMWTLGLTLSL